MTSTSNYLSQIAGSATAQIFSKAKELENKGEDVVHLEIGQPDFPPLPVIIEETVTALNNLKVQYTMSKGIPELRNAVSNYYKKYTDTDPNSEVIITAGGKLGIFGAVWSVLNPGDNVIVLNPSWVSYGDIVMSLGGEVRYVPVNISFDFDEELLRRQIDSRTKAVIVNSPSNPTGAIISAKGMKLLYDLCAEYDLLLVSDEMYNEYTYDTSFHSLGEIKGWQDHGVIVNGLSKTFSMTGYRVGYTLSNSDIAVQVNKVMQLTASCATNFSQWAGVAAFNNIDLMRSFIKKTMLPRRSLVSQLLGEISGIEYKNPAGAIYSWFKLDGVTDSMGWGQRLLEDQKVAITPGRAFGPAGEGYIRVCFATDEGRLKEGIHRIASFVEKR